MFWVSDPIYVYNLVPKIHSFVQIFVTYSLNQNFKWFFCLKENKIISAPQEKTYKWFTRSDCYNYKWDDEWDENDLVSLDVNY